MISAVGMTSPSLFVWAEGSLVHWSRPSWTRFNEYGCDPWPGSAQSGNAGGMIAQICARNPFWMRTGQPPALQAHALAPDLRMVAMAKRPIKPAGDAVRIVAKQAGRTSMQSLEGKVAWVTGAGTGIGEGAALALARVGALVVLTGRRREPLEAVAGKITEAGGKPSMQPADVAKAAAVQKVADTIRAQYGRIDIVVNNAGMNIPERAWNKLKPEGADAVIQGNLTSAFYVVQAALPIMRAQKDGVIMHTAS